MRYSLDIFELLNDGEDVFATVTNVSDHDIPYADIDIMIRKYFFLREGLFFEK